MSLYETLNLLLQAIVAVAAFATLAFLYRQIRVMVDQLLATQESSRAQTALAIVNFLQSAEARASRHCVRQELSQKPLDERTEDDRRHASLVCANYDVAAALLKANLAPTDYSSRTGDQASGIGIKSSLRTSPNYGASLAPIRCTGETLTGCTRWPRGRADLHMSSTPVSEERRVG